DAVRTVRAVSRAARATLSATSSHYCPPSPPRPLRSPLSLCRVVPVEILGLRLLLDPLTHFLLIDSPRMGPRANERDFVIKVKCGETLKWFSTCIYGDMIDHNMTRLRKKIINLFKLSPEADFVHIYIDVDGDIVALDDDDELHETAINQPLNPLRISVLLRSNASDGHDLKHENM
ncbi:unnamed protein product, partial [Musa banksii]